jgi:hypothetical protein
MTRVATIALCSVIFAKTAAAQPGVCNVKIVRAPDAVREVVESWVRDEPRCSGTLEVRILPTDGGYYLFARDAAGRLRERLVPDPQSAGVLIASWAADDAPPAESPTPSFVPVAPMQDPFVDSAPRTPSFLRWGGWMTLGYVTSGATHGWRAEADLVGHGPLAAGVSLSRTAFDLSFQVSLPNGTGAVYLEPGTVRGLDTRATVYGSDTFRQGPLSLRIGLGAGAMHTASLATAAMYYNAAGWQPIGEMSLEVGLEAGRWSLTAGAIGTAFKQAWLTGSYVPFPQPPDEVKRNGDLLGMFGARCRL